MAYRVTSVTIEDGKDIGQHNVRTMWTDSAWRLGWQFPLEEVMRLGGMRGPANILRDRETKRHLKAVDEGGQLVGYARFRFPQVYKSQEWQDVWPETIVPDISKERREQLGIDESFAATIEKWEGGNEDLPLVDQPVSTTNKRLLETRQGHMGLFGLFR